MEIETSLKAINDKFNGLHPGQVVVVSGYPGGGKTALAGQFAADAAMGGHNTLVVSLEMPGKELMARMLAYVARVPGDAVTDPLRHAREVYSSESLPKRALEAIGGAAVQISKAPFHIEDLRGADVHTIAACIRRAHRKEPLRLVVVDFAQRITAISDNAKQTREQQLSHAANYLADLAQELGFVLILPSQLSKEGAAKHCEAINESADLHIRIVQNMDKNSPDHKAHIGLAVDKDRHHGHDGELLHIVLDGPMIRFIPKPFTK